MKPHSLFLFPIIWIASAPFSSAAPAPLPAADEIPSILISSRNALPDLIAEDANITSSSHLVKRGCFQSKPDPTGPITCDGSIPPADEMRAQMARRGNVGVKVSAFYTALGGAGGMAAAKCWVNSHPAQIPNPPGAVFFDEIVPADWEAAVGQAMINSDQGTAKITSYQKLLSQIFAEESKGTAWIFAPAALDFSTLDDKNTWKNWEFPALTKNPNIDKVLRADPSDQNDPPTISTVWVQGQPTQEPRGLVFPL